MNAIKEVWKRHSKQVIIVANKHWVIHKFIFSMGKIWELKNRYFDISINFLIESLQTKRIQLFFLSYEKKLYFEN